MNDSGEDSPNLIPVQKGINYGYIGVSGELKIPWRFVAADYFHERLASVCIELRPGVHKYGYIDPTGTMAIQCAYDYAGPFCNGLAGVKAGRYWGFINRKGVFEIRPQFSDAGHFAESLACVHSESGSGFVDRHGNVAYWSPSDNAIGFAEGLGLIFCRSETAEYYRFIDQTGKTVRTLDPELVDVHLFHEGMAKYQVSGNGYGFLNKDFEVAIAPRFQFVAEFEEGLCPAFSNPDDAWGFIDSSGRFVIGPSFEDVEYFSEGVCSVRVGGKWGCIDRTGRFVIEPKYPSAFVFRHGLAKVADGGIPCYVDKKGRCVWRE